MNNPHKSCVITFAAMVMFAVFLFWQHHRYRVAIREQLNAVEQRLDHVQADVNRFDDENWRDVVPDVRGSVEQLAIEIDRTGEMLSAEK